MLTDLRESRRVFEVLLAAPAPPSRTIQAYEVRARRALAKEAMLQARLAQAAADGHPAEHRHLADFAVDTWPQVRRTRDWRAYERGNERGLRPAQRHLVRWAHEVRWKVRWQRWRVLGT